MGMKELLKERRSLLIVEFDSSMGHIVADLYEELYFEQEQILEHMESQAGMLAWWNALYRDMEEKLNECETEYEIWFALRYEVAYRELKDEMGGGSKKPNISSVENYVRIMNRKKYRDWQRRLRKLRRQSSTLKDVVKWYEEKGMMLVQMAKLASAEMGAIDLHAKKGTEEVKRLKRNMME